MFANKFIIIFSCVCQFVLRRGQSNERQSPLEKKRACLGVENTCGMGGGGCRGVDLENTGAVL